MVREREREDKGEGQPLCATAYTMALPASDVLFGQLNSLDGTVDGERQRGDKGIGRREGLRFDGLGI